MYIFVLHISSNCALITGFPIESIQLLTCTSLILYRCSSTLINGSLRSEFCLGIASRPTECTGCFSTHAAVDWLCCSALLWPLSMVPVPVAVGIGVVTGGSGSSLVSLSSINECTVAHRSVSVRNKTDATPTKALTTIKATAVANSQSFTMRRIVRTFACSLFEIGQECQPMCCVPLVIRTSFTPYNNCVLVVCKWLANMPISLVTAHSTLAFTRRAHRTRSAHG